MSRQIFPFAPGATSTLAASTTSASVSIDPYATAVRVLNAGSQLAFIRFAGTATTADLPIPSGATEVFTKNGAASIAAITAASTTTLYVTTGEGL